MQQLTIPPLNEGEIYIGCIGNAKGEVEHVILLPGDNDDATWKAQMDWAKSIGGDLPNRVEQAMLFANFRDEFKKDWYWSNELLASGSACAWGQGFGYGYQGYNLMGGLYRARAVRRSTI